MFLVWGLLIGNLVFWSAFWVWRERGRASTTESGPDFFHVIFFVLLGGFFLMVALAGYILCVFTTCLTFDLSRPVWNVVKRKLFIANILVSLAASLGIGFVLSAFLTPALTAIGLDAGMANMLPVMGSVMLFQVAQLWILIWAPLEKRLIERRLFVQGITADQVRGGICVGLSNPASGMLKRFGAIEEDMGVLWLSQEQLIFRGDNSAFSLTRDQITQIERRADARSTTMLAGIAHVILHTSAAAPSEREIRLHTEGHLTMGRKRDAMNRLGDAITMWHSKAPVPLQS